MTRLLYVILIGDLILAQALQGFRQDPDLEKERRNMKRFLQANIVSPSLALQSPATIACCGRKESLFVNP
jgi:hypothetical protein